MNVETKCVFLRFLSETACVFLRFGCHVSIATRDLSWRRIPDFGPFVKHRFVFVFRFYPQTHISNIYNLSLSSLWTGARSPNFLSSNTWPNATLSQQSLVLCIISAKSGLLYLPKASIQVKATHPTHPIQRKTTHPGLVNPNQATQRDWHNSIINDYFNIFTCRSSIIAAFKIGGVLPVWGQGGSSGECGQSMRIYGWTLQVSFWITLEINHCLDFRGLQRLHDILGNSGKLEILGLYLS